MVHWLRPHGNNWKFNTNSSFMTNQRKGGAGGIVRNISGNMTMAFAYPTQFYTNNFSEAQVAVIRITWCCDQQFDSLELDMDSMIIVQLIQGSVKPPWSLHNLIENIQKKMNQRNIQVNHCIREDNEVIDALAKYATTISDERILYTENDLPGKARDPLRMNKLHLPNFRRKTKKHSTWYYDPS
ncbi:uncharacterized protein [Nicotiana tomentosiformis]|uniref:uncharacterized protein n=1 Tax=Nicotiana tomentosiformis TaxID=4098 RepID=UPI00388CCDE9